VPYEACGDALTLALRERQLPDESVVMRYPTRAYQTDQPSQSRPFCHQHLHEDKYRLSELDRSIHTRVVRALSSGSGHSACQQRWPCHLLRTSKESQQACMVTLRQSEDKPKSSACSALPVGLTKRNARTSVSRNAGIGCYLVFCGATPQRESSAQLFDGRAWSSLGCASLGHEINDDGFRNG
jgi:hypothetical protein